MKKSSILSIMLVAVAVLTVGISVGKFVKTNSSSANLDVANWNVTIGNLSTSNKTYTSASLTANKIAPGTEGQWNFTIDATGTETGLSYKVDFSTNTLSKPKNMYFMVGETKYTDLTTAMEEALSGTISADSSTKSVTKTIKWVWPYETGTTDAEKATNNAQDTTDAATFASKNVTFNININVEQLAPSAQ